MLTCESTSCDRVAWALQSNAKAEIPLNADTTGCDPQPLQNLWSRGIFGLEDGIVNYDSEFLIEAIDVTLNISLVSKFDYII